MHSFLETTISPREEMLSYETLWGMKNATQKSIAELFRSRQGTPHEVLQSLAQEDPQVAGLRREVEEYLRPLRGFSVKVHGAFQYPEQLRDAKHPLEVIYYRGDIDLLGSNCISVVGSRSASQEGVIRARRLAKELVEAKWTIVSGLAAGIDTAAMSSAIDAGGRTIGVIGTPITETYPVQNAKLQETVARDHLLISQVPFFRYHHQPFNSRKYYFPARNETMAALSKGTVIVEAGETSGTLTQARAALQQGRRLFILNSCFENKAIAWPSRLELQGAIRVKTTDEILEVLKHDG